MINMNEKEHIDEDLEEELDKAFKEIEKKPKIFGIIRNEKEAQSIKEKRTKVKIKPNK